MAYYRQVGEVPSKRHTAFRDEQGTLRYEELMGEEGFSSDSSLLYHRGVPSAIVDSQVWELPDLTMTREPPAQAAAPEAAHALRPPTGREGDRPGAGPAAGARQRRRADLLRRGGRDLAVLPQRGRRRVRLRRAGQRHRRDGVRRAALPHRRLRDRAAGDHAPLGAGRGEHGSTRSRRTATSPRRSATSRASASCSSTRRTASATCTGPASRSSSRAPTWRCWSSTAATGRPASSAAG